MHYRLAQQRSVLIDIIIRQNCVVGGVDQPIKCTTAAKCKKDFIFTNHEAAVLEKELALEERNRLWSFQETRRPSLRHMDTGLRMRLAEWVPRMLGTLYPRLRLNAALTNSYRHHLGQSSNPYCDNCGLPETVEHVPLECPAYIQERNHLAEKIECLNY